MTWLLWLGLAVCLLAVAWAVASTYGSRRWRRITRALTQQLDTAALGAAGQAALPARYDARELEGLPAPVQRYFRAVLKPGQAIIAAATIDMTGTFNLSADAQQWKPFTSTQRAVTRRPGFLWDAKVALLPGLPVRVLDRYIASVGQLRAAVLGLFTVADAQGDGELARGEFMRWFAEAAWYPTALLPSQGVRWTAVDDASAHGTVVDGPLTLTLLFGFDAAGLVTSVSAAARGAGVGKAMVMLPWVCTLSDYQPQHGMLLPMRGEAAWLRPQGRQSYFRGTVTRVSHEFRT